MLRFFSKLIYIHVIEGALIPECQHDRKGIEKFFLKVRNFANRQE